MKRYLLTTAIVAMVLTSSGVAWAADQNAVHSDLAKAFQSPPASAKPHAFWYWMDGHATREGIDADLEAMRRVGIGGIELYPAIMGHALPGSLKTMGPEWYALLKHALRRARELGIEVDLNNSPAGWSSTNGPWITPEISMQKLTWSETRVQGGKSFSGTLPQPPTVKDFYRDIAVLAFPTPKAEQTDVPIPEVSSSQPGLKAGLLFDGKEDTFCVLPEPAKGQTQFLELTYQEPVQARSLGLTPRARRTIRGGKLLVPEGKAWRTVAALPHRESALVAVAFPPVASRVWRVEFDGQRDIELAELYLGPRYRIPQWSGKAKHDLAGLDKPAFTPSTLAAPPECSIAPASIIELSAKMDASGRLEWTVPPGNWTILRFGHTLNGIVKAGGLECDKFDPAALDVHWSNYLEPLLKDPQLGPAIQYLHIDSYEAGAQNWSHVLPGEFKKRMGYAILRFLPALTGRVVGDLETSERFLWDFRQVCCDLMAENYFGHMQELCHRQGKQFSLEPYCLCQFHNGTVGSKADVPMCEFWACPRPVPSHLFKVGSSAAHLYGRPLVGAEAFTANRVGGGDYTTDPWALKILGDSAFCGGVNRYVLTLYVLQPWLNQAPGMTLAAYGTHFERTNTWFEQMTGFNTYVSRCQHLLQQGQFIADVLYFWGENNPNEIGNLPFSGRGGLGAMIPGYDYDVAGPEVILKRLSVHEGRLDVEGGMSYRVLVLPGDDYLTPAMLRKLHALVQAGATVMGPKPLRSPSLMDQPKADEEVHKLAAELWGDCDGKTVTEHRFGQGRIVWGKPLKEVLASLGVVEDFQAGPEKSPLHYIHRRLDQGELYFVANSDDSKQAVDGAFRVSGRRPELWDPLTGEIRSLPEYRQEGGRTVVPLRFEPRQSYFVMFGTEAQRHRGTEAQRGKNFPAYKPVLELAGPWQVTFDPKWGGPDKPVTFDKLVDWTTRPESGIKYYSGKATYRKTFDFQSSAVASDGRSNPPASLYLDLGTVKNLAAVRLNGKDLGVVWCAPWRAEITGVVRAKGNQLEIDLVNLWPNRMIGDEQLPDDCEYSDQSKGFGGMALRKLPQWLLENKPRPSGRYTFGNWRHFKKDDPLLPSGLLGPVTVKREE